MLLQSQRSRAGKRQSISSHSIRRAAVSICMATGVTLHNITRWVHWRQGDMPWTYIDHEYVLPNGCGWDSFFAWLKGRIAQNA